MATVDQLKSFVGKTVRATCMGNLKSVEDIDDIREHLINKYGADSVVEKPTLFIVKGKPYIKPWLPKERIGTFHLAGLNYYIKNKVSSTQDGRIRPRRSLYSIENLEVVDHSMLVLHINKARDEYLLYTVQADEDVEL